MFFPTLATVSIVISALCVIIGWILVKLKKYDAHIQFMNTAAIFATAFFVIYIYKLVNYGNTPFPGPETLQGFYIAFLIFHILLASIGGMLGLVTLQLGYRERYEKHRRLGPWASFIWLLSALTGVFVYLVLYVFPWDSYTLNLLTFGL
ncbi:DUF420 domain-containing protein [Bacillaceae bacterium SIJ1]|nr:DUF420 domain-containing protein [Litoribacterium kuwaitense]